MTNNLNSKEFNIKIFDKSNTLFFEGNKIINTNNSSFISTPNLEKPILQRGVHINENFNSQKEEKPRNYLFNLLNTKYRNKAEQLKAIIQKQEQEAFNKLINDLKDENEKEEEEEDYFCESDHEDLKEEYEKELKIEKEQKEEENKKTTCLQLQQESPNKPTDQDEAQVQEWNKERRRIIIEHTKCCDFCQSIPPKKLQ